MKTKSLFELWCEGTEQPFVWGELSQSEREHWAACYIHSLIKEVEHLKKDDDNEGVP